jgi:hypothetical protein
MICANAGQMQNQSSKIPGGSELPILRVDRGDILAGFALKY